MPGNQMGPVIILTNLFLFIKRQTTIKQAPTLDRTSISLPESYIAFVTGPQNETVVFGLVLVFGFRKTDS
jgi:hypothetical protein